MKRFAAHLAAIAIAVVATMGVLLLPSVFQVGLPGAFTIAWLLLAGLALIAQMRRANLFARRGQAKSAQRRPQRARGM